MSGQGRAATGQVGAGQSRVGQGSNKHDSCTCLLDSPSHLRILVKTQVVAGIFNPMAKVSVANRHCSIAKENQYTFCFNVLSVHATET